jgi:cytochrome c biogenesis factor
MILWLWVGTFVMAAGTALAIVPRRRGARRADAEQVAEPTNPAEQSTSA